MQSKVFFALLFSLKSFLSFAQAIENPIRVACVGNSITYGAAVENRAINCYPNQLQRMLGADYEVHNFGVSGATLLNLGDKPYMKENAYKEALASKPEILIVKLGTNDSKPFNWDDYKGYFIRDYKSLIQSFRQANPDVKVFICLPVPVYGDAFNIREKVVQNEILSLVTNVASSEKATLIDLNTPLLNKAEWFPDKIHPNAAGAKKIAELVFNAIKDTKVR